MTQENALQATMAPAPLQPIAPAVKAMQSGSAPPAEGYSGARCTAIALDSSLLLQGHKAVAIRHNGTVYRLQATNLGKLILTK